VAEFLAGGRSVQLSLIIAVVLVTLLTPPRQAPYALLVAARALAVLVALRMPRAKVHRQTAHR